MFVTRPDGGIELRLLEERHTEAVYALVDGNRAYLREWLPWVDSTRSPQDIEIYIKGGLQGLADNGAFNAGIWLNNALVGVVSYHRIDWADHTTAIGYWLAAGHQGRGIMTRAVQQMIDYAFDELQLNRVEIHCAISNARSRSLPERLGCVEEGVLHQAEWLNDRFVDHVIYAVLAEDWRKTRGRESLP